MSTTIQLTAKRRDTVGKGASRRLRRMQDEVPGIVYGGGEPPLNVTFAHKDLVKAQQHEGFYSQILTLDLEGKPQKVLLKDLQRHPVKSVVMHIDFQRITGKETLHLNVPLHFINEDKAPALKEGAIISHLMKDIEVITSPANLPEYIEVDLGNLGLDESVHLSDVKLPKGVTSVALSHGLEHDHPVASAHRPRAALELEVEAEEVVEGSEESQEAAEGEPEAPAEGE